MSTEAPRLRAAGTTPLRVGSIVRWVPITIGVVVAVVPFLWMLSVSFRTEADVFANPGSLLPGAWTLHGYIGVWEQLPFLRLVLNTVVFAGVTTILTLVLDSLCAYALARLRFRGRNVAFVLVIATLMVPFQVTLIPVFIELFHLGWLNTYQGLIIPRATSAFGIFLLRQSFLTIPAELDEAARIDGAGHLRIYARVILPLSKPALATVGLLNFMALWNDLLWPLIVTSDAEMRTLPAGLTLFGGAHVTDHAVLLAGATISLLPLAVAFFLAQRFFVEGVATTGMK
ncbi:carbohydrate ABC transporter permease [uncultured Amnibacterium sp.]|uniref:carbohydrate ABC transporter permease n=1 Tax=uncultured Amnibacterium sp. TaxID=1631851 RepID=UPI0035C9B704